MHDIEPHWNWRDRYIGEEDELSPFFGRSYDEFGFSNKVYNYYIHPQWDEFGSSTLYVKIIFVDYADGYAVIELIGEWNDTLYNDIMHLKRNVIDVLMGQEITKFILIGENVLNFHTGDDDYYVEWYEEVSENGGWISMINFRDHVREEMEELQLQLFTHFDPPLDNVNWRLHKPQNLFNIVEKIVRHPTSFRLRGS